MLVSSILKAYDYAFPKGLIAKAPASPRDAARLLVYNEKEQLVSWDTFRNLSSYLPARSLLVFNDTKVMPARLLAKKETGGIVQLLYVGHTKHLLYALCEKPLHVGAHIYTHGKAYFTVCGKEEGVYILSYSLPMSYAVRQFFMHGRTPIPPYIKDTPLSEKALRTAYQTVFARYAGSTAAPTASLHFTRRLLKNLTRDGHEICFVTLHVGLGTFASLSTHNLENGVLHKEAYAISKRTEDMIRKAKREGRPVIAVGTTVVRALESASDANGLVRQSRGETDIFIREGYTFRCVDGMITNFHVPQSSLLMLVAAFIGRNTILKLYRSSIQKHMRLFSFGDGMLLLKKNTGNENYIKHV